MPTPSNSNVEKTGFREAMSRLSSAVCVVTSDGPAGRLGFTASAVCSVSDDPPTLLVCMNRMSQQHVPLRENGVFSVNILNGEQVDVSALFAGVGGLSTAERFERVAWATLVTGSPVISDCVASCDCEISQIHEFSTHSVIFGNVVALRLSEPCLPSLSYFARKYHSLEAR
jgi:flavin reductase